MNKHHGFTLIELLVVIVIIGLLSGIGIASFQGSIEKTKIGNADADLKDIKDIIVSAQIASGKSLASITGSGCSYCSVCRGGINLKDVATTHGCYVAWQNATAAIDAVRGGIQGISDLDRDPWGSPYVMDENEGEWGITDCRKDFIESVGPNGVWDGVTLVGNDYQQAGDDILIRIPNVTASCL